MQANMVLDPMSTQPVTRNSGLPGGDGGGWNLIRRWSALPLPAVRPASPAMLLLPPQLPCFRDDLRWWRIGVSQFGVPF
jgi:hypothetical protein